MPFLTSPIFYVIAFLVVTNIGTALGWRWVAADLQDAEQKLETCKAGHQAFVDRVAARGKIAEEQAKWVKEYNERIADETSKGWAAALDSVRRDAERRVRLATAGHGAFGGGVSAGGATPDRVVVATEEPLPPPERIIADCAEDTLKLVWLQDWVKRTSTRN